MFERYLVDHNLYEELGPGGFEIMSALYEDPDAYCELLTSPRLRGLARSLMEECMSERRMQVSLRVSFFSLLRAAFCDFGFCCLAQLPSATDAAVTLAFTLSGCRCTNRAMPQRGTSPCES